MSASSADVAESEAALEALWRERETLHEKHNARYRKYLEAEEARQAALAKQRAEEEDVALHVKHVKMLMSANASRHAEHVVEANGSDAAIKAALADADARADDSLMPHLKQLVELAVSKKETHLLTGGKKRHAKLTPLGTLLLELDEHVSAVFRKSKPATKQELAAKKQAALKAKKQTAKAIKESENAIKQTEDALKLSEQQLRDGVAQAQRDGVDVSNLSDSGDSDLSFDADDLPELVDVPEDADDAAFYNYPSGSSLRSSGSYEEIVDDRPLADYEDVD